MLVGCERQYNILARQNPSRKNALGKLVRDPLLSYSLQALKFASVLRVRSNSPYIAVGFNISTHFTIFLASLKKSTPFFHSVD